jgi:hypothetical protein
MVADGAALAGRLIADRALPLGPKFATIPVTASDATASEPAAHERRQRRMIA